MSATEHTNLEAAQIPPLQVGGCSEEEAVKLLKSARRAFVKGDHLTAGRLAARAQEVNAPTIQEDARLLRERMSPAPLAKYLLLLTFILLLFVTLLAYQR
jgi:hypothetical protein